MRRVTVVVVRWARCVCVRWLRCAECGAVRWHAERRQTLSTSPSPPALRCRSHRSAPTLTSPLPLLPCLFSLSLSLSLLSSLLQLPDSLYKVKWSFGLDTTKFNNMSYLDDTKLIFASGNMVQVMDTSTPDFTREFLQGIDMAIGALALTAQKDYIAVGGVGDNPRVCIYDVKTMRLYRVLRNGTMRAYSDMYFRPDGLQLATVGASPDFMLTLWDWRNESVILRKLAFRQEIYRLAFSPMPGIVLTSGVTHIRFWKTARTFTGLKLEGALGKFGKSEMSDVRSFAELPDGKVISTTTKGPLYLWEGNMVKSELYRDYETKVGMHDGAVHDVKVDVATDASGNRCFVSCGDDGYVRWWPFDTIDNAEPDEVEGISVEPIGEVRVGGDANGAAFGGETVTTRNDLNGLLRGNNHWLVQDGGAGAIWRIDGKSGQPPRKNQAELMYSCHAGAVNALAVSPLEHLAVTCGADGTVRCWDYASGKCLFSQPFALDSGERTAANCIVYAPRSVDPLGRTVVVGFADGVLRYLMRGDNKWRRLNIIKPHRTEIVALAWDPRGVVIASASSDGQVWLTHNTNVDGQATGEDDVITVVPIGYIEIEGSANSLSWRDDSDALLIASSSGAVIEISNVLDGVRLAQDNSSYVLGDYTERRTLVVEPPKAPKPVVAKVETTGDEDDMGPDPIAAALAAAEAAAPPPPALSAIYKQGGDDRILITLGKKSVRGEHGVTVEPMFECEFGREKPLIVHGHHALPTTQIAYSQSERFMITASQDGSVRVYPQNKLSSYINLDPHDGLSGGCSTAVMAWDDTYVITSGFDGQLFVYRVIPDAICEAAQAMEEELARMKPAARRQAAKGGKEAQQGIVDAMRRAIDKFDADATLAVDGVKPITDDQLIIDAVALIPEATDITSKDHYSVEEFAIKTQEDAEIAAAEEKKVAVREMIVALRRDYEKVAEANASVAASEQLGEKEMDIDPILTADVQATISAQAEELKLVLAYDTQKAQVGLEKLKGAYINTMLFEYVKLHAFQSQDTVSTFRLSAFSEKMLAVLKDVHVSIDEEEAQRARRRLDEEEHLLNATSGKNGDDDDDSPTDREAVAGKRIDTAAKKLRTEELRDLARRERERKLKMLEAARPAENADDPRDLLAIENAKKNMGDFKLKGAEDYVVPEKMQMTAERKRRQIALLFESIQNIRRAFNTRVMQLRILKQQIIESVTNDNERLRVINAQLGIKAKLTGFTIDPTETPEARFEIAIEDVIAYGKAKDPTLFAEAFSAEDLSAVKAKISTAGSAPSSSAADSGSSSGDAGSSAASAIVPSSSIGGDDGGDGGGSDTQSVAWIRRQWNLLEMGAERLQLMDRVDKSVAAFDLAIRQLCSQKFRLGAELKAAEMRSIAMHSELQYLKDEEKRDRLLQQRLFKIQKDSYSIVGDLSTTKTSISVQSKDVAKWKEKKTAVENQFHELVPESNEHRAPLFKIFKRRIRRTKATADGEEVDDDEESEDDMSDSDSDSEDDDEEEMCPIGCDQALYDKVRELREKRCSIEEVRVRVREGVTHVVWAVLLIFV